MNPEISIIIPVFNRSELLNETLDSILNQSYPHWECLVVDDGSTDGTLEVIKRFEQMDSRFKVFSRPETRLKGAPSCRNIGLQHAKGEYVLFFDSDDVMLRNALSERVTAVEASPHCDFWVFQTQRFYKAIGDDKALWNDLSQPNATDLNAFLNINPVWHTSGVLWRKAFLDASDLAYREGVLSWQDWEFHIRVLLQAPNYIKHPHLAAHVFQRFHDGEAINSTVTDSVVLNRLALLIGLVDDFKTAKLWHAHEQALFLKLFYFIGDRHSFLPEYSTYWKRLAEHFDELPALDVWFWKQYLFIGWQPQRRFYYRTFKCLQALKKLYFSKRLSVVDFPQRTWYKIELT